MLPELHQQTMAPKRTYTEADIPCDSKRSKMVGNDHANPCETASLVIEASATSSISRSDISEDDDSTSDDSDSVNEDTDEEEDREENLSILQKPTIDPHYVIAYAKELRDKLQAFLPQLQNANRELASNAANLNMETVGDDEQHIEMDLRLGVLEQQQDNQNPSQPDDIQIPKASSRSSLPFRDSPLAEMPSVSDLISGGQRLAEGSIQVVATETDAAD
jgi:hypothetical protein